MSSSDNLPEIFSTLKEIFTPYAKHMTIVTDKENHYYLDTHHIAKNKKPLFFGAVQTKKNWVSYHLMPVYFDPTLLDLISDKLKKRLHGKSCFNFKKNDDELISELTILTESAFQSYIEEGYIQDVT